MSSERWERIQQVFHAALERAADEQDSFVTRVCATDDELRDEVLSLLDAHRREGPVVSPLGRRDPNDRGEVPKTPLRAREERGDSNVSTRLKRALRSRYVIGSEVGSGGMAQVFLAQDVRHDRKVAVKVLRPDVGSRLGRERFLREIRLAARLTHPHILPLHDSGEAAGLLYYVMPYVEGDSLRERLRAKDPLPVAEALDITRAIGAALDYAHRQDVVHRDIKPENILLQAGEPMVADFGIGKALSAAGAEDITTAGMLLGTPAYMSPEQIGGATTLDGRSDLYSLGCVLYEMLTGGRLFSGSSPQALVFGRLAQPSPSLQFPDSVPTHVRSAVRSLLAVAPEDRVPSAAKLLELLKQPESAPSIHATTAPSIAVSQATGKSIAVLPFANLSSDEENEYFSDGMTEEIINALAQIPGLRVAARTSSFAFKDRAADVTKVGAQLKVATVLEGSVRREGKRLRVTAQLIEVGGGYHLWSERYDRELDDVFGIQDDIARTIAARLELTLAGDAGVPAANRSPNNVDAYQLYLKGRHVWNKRTRAGLEQSVEYFRAAIERDPDYALAYTGLADAHLLLGSYGYESAETALGLAREATERALSLDEALAEAHASHGQVLRSELNWRGEEEEYRRAIALKPSYATAHQWYATLLAALGREHEALGEIRRAQELDPLSHAIGVTRGAILFLARDYQGAIAQLKSTLELEPDFFSAWAWMTTAYLEVGRLDDAIAANERLMALRPDFPFTLLNAYTLARAGRRDEALEILKAVPERRTMAGMIGLVHAALGDLDRAFEWMDRSFEDESWRFFVLHKSLLFYIKVHPWYDPLRSDPRFGKLLKRMGLGAAVPAVN